MGLALWQHSTTYFVLLYAAPSTTASRLRCIRLLCDKQANNLNFEKHWLSATNSNAQTKLNLPYDVNHKKFIFAPAPNTGEVRFLIGAYFGDRIRIAVHVLFMCAVVDRRSVVRSPQKTFNGARQLYCWLWLTQRLIRRTYLNFCVNLSRVCLHCIWCTVKVTHIRKRICIYEWI